MSKLKETDPGYDPEHPGARGATELLENPELLDRLARLAARALRAPAAVIGLTTVEGDVAVSSVGLAEPWSSGRRVPLERSLCRQVTTDGEPLVVEDAREDPRLEGDPAAEEAGAVAYAGLPLQSSEGRVLGCLCVVDHEPRRWSDEEVETLREFAALIVAEFERSARTAEARDRYFRALVRGVHDIITVLDSSGTVVYDSPSIQRVLGYDPGHRVGDHILDLVHPDDREEAVAALKEGRETREGVPELTVRLRHRDGSFRVLEVKGRNLLDDPVVRGAVLTCRDVTERVRSEDQRNQALSLLRATLESTADGILVFDLEGRVKSYNQRFLDLWEVPADLARTREARDLLAWAAGQASDPDAFAAQSASLTSDRHAEISDVVALKDGRIIERYSQPQRLGQEVVGCVASFRDVTDHRRAAEALRKSGERLRLSHEIGRMGVWEWHLREGEVVWSPELERLHGLEPGTFEGTFEAFRREIHPEDLERVLEYVEKAVEARRDYSIEYRIINPDGGVRWLSARWEVFSDASGAPARMLGICADVTERKQAEEDLRRSRAFLRAIVDASPNLIFVQDQDGRYMMANPAVARVFGTTVEEMLGRTDQELGMAAEDVERFRREDHTVIESGEPQSFSDIPVTDPLTGEMRWYQKTKVPFRVSPSGPVHVLGVATDITDRVRSEAALHESGERYRLITQATNDLIYDWDLATGEIEWNGASSVFGHPVERMSPHAIWFLEQLHPEDRQTVVSSLHRALQEGGHSWSCEYRFLRHDGSYATVFDQGRIVRDSAGEPVRMLGAIMDLTERRKLEEELRETQKMDAIARVAGGIAHEFNNALMEIRGNAQLGLMDLPPGDSRRTELETIGQAADRAASLTRHLIAISRTQMLHPQIVELNTALTGMRAPLQRELGDQIRVVMHLATPGPKVRVDPSGLEELVRNLVLNAAEAMPEGGTLQVETGSVGGDPAREEASQTRSPPPYAWLSVSDTGTGMDEATLGRIWEPFFTTREGRRGVGLSAVYGMVKQSGGEVEAESTPGEGSTFTVYLPLAPEDSTAPASPLPPAAEDAGADTILLVEDEDGVRNVARRVLERAGYRVLEAASAEEALRILERQGAPVRLLLTDVVLPGMNGPELARHLTRARPGMKTIFMSGYTADEFLAEGVIDSAAAFISKPFDLRLLVEQVRHALEGVGGIGKRNDR